MLRITQVGKWTISEVGALQGVRMNLFRKQADEYITAQKRNGAMVDGMEETLAEWVQIAACVSPLLTIDEYLTMPAVEIMPLVEGMAQVNEQSASESDGKKKRKMAKSTDA